MNYIVAVHVVQTAKNHAHDATQLLLTEQTLVLEARICIHLLNLLIDDLLELSGFLQVLHHDE